MDDCFDDGDRDFTMVTSLTADLLLAPEEAEAEADRDDDDDGDDDDDDDDNHDNHDDDDDDDDDNNNNDDDDMHEQHSFKELWFPKHLVLVWFPSWINIVLWFFQIPRTISFQSPYSSTKIGPPPPDALKSKSDTLGLYL